MKSVVLKEILHNENNASKTEMLATERSLQVPPKIEYGGARNKFFPKSGKRHHEI